MAVIKKTLFPKNLDKYAILVNDTQSDSKYFKITELPDTFTGGKNAFLIAGSEYLVPDTKIQIELKDSAGNIIYHEPGEGLISSSVNGESFISEYYEGVSKVVAVYVYPDTAYGPCTLTILGELSEYQDTNGLTLPVPLDWENKYNVKWQKQIDVNPSLANTTKIRFYQRPITTITEIISPIYRIESGSKVDSGTNQSFANIKLSRLETFAGDVKRVKVFRTSEGDISDYDLIQDILVESKELLTTFGLSGSVVGQTGILTSETLKNNWNTGSLNAFLTSSRVESGVRLTGSGYFTYTSSLDIKSANTYELNLDAFYSASISTNLGIYLVSGSASSSIATLNGTAPTKNLLDTVIPFKVDKDFVSASLYFSQSQGEWHLGNISLKLSQDTAFSPDEITFITTMPTVIGNETYNFKFEFYDVNNNYVPVAVTQSANFTGGTNTSNTTLLISASLSQSLAALAAVSTSISGTMTVYSSSASSSISSLSSSVSSSNVFILSSSLSKVQQLANGQFSGSFIGDTFIYSPTIGGQQGYISELFKVGTTPSIYLDARQDPRKIFIGGVSDSGSYNNSNTSVYMDSTGKFSLKDKLTWDGTNLSVNGSINVTGGNAATQTYANTIGTNSVLSGSASANAAQTAAQLFATSIGNNAVLSGSSAASVAQTAAINQAKTDASASVNLLANGNWTGGSGTFITSNSISSPIIAGNGGYISSVFRVGNNGITLDGVNKKIFVGTGTYNNANTPFYFASGSTDIFSLGNKLTWDGTTLGITGNITVSGGNAATTTQVGTAQTTANNAATAASNAATAASNAQTSADSKIPSGSAAADVNSNATTISGGKIRTGIIESTGYAYTSGNFSTTGTQINLDNGLIRSKNFSITSAGDAFFKGNITGASGNIGGWIIGNNFLSSSNGKIIFNSATPEISYTGGTNANFKLSTGLINDISGISGVETSTTYLGDGGMVFCGNRDVSGNLKNQIRIDNYGDYTRAYFYDNGATTYTDEIVWISKVTDANSAALKVQGGGIEVNSTGTANRGYCIYGGGSATFGGDVIANTSDGRLKTNIKNIDSPLEKISKINGVYFNWNEKAKELADKDTEIREVGFIAQEVQSVMPEIIKPAAFDLKLKSGENYLTIQYEKIVPLLVECIKELKLEIEELKKNK